MSVHVSTSPAPRFKQLGKEHHFNPTAREFLPLSPGNAPHAGDDTAGKQKTSKHASTRQSSQAQRKPYPAHD